MPLWKKIVAFVSLVLLAVAGGIGAAFGRDVFSKRALSKEQQKDQTQRNRETALVDGKSTAQLTLANETAKTEVLVEEVAHQKRVADIVQQVEAKQPSGDALAAELKAAIKGEK
jgi:hypothetical protein